MKYFPQGFLFHAFASQERFILIQEGSHKSVFISFADLGDREQESQETKRQDRERK